MLLFRIKTQQAQAAFELSHTNVHFGISHCHTWKQCCHRTGVCLPPLEPSRTLSAARSSEQAHEMETLERESTFVPKAVTIFHQQ